MASQEHLAMLHNEDDEDESSSTTTSSDDDEDDDDEDDSDNDSNVEDDDDDSDDSDDGNGEQDDDSDDDDDDGDSSSSSSTGLVRPAIAPFMGKTVAAMQVSPPADRVDNEEASIPTMPAKKGMKLGLDKTENEEQLNDSMDIDAVVETSTSDVVNVDNDLKSLSHSSELPTVEAMPITKPEPAPLTSAPPKKKIKSTPHKARMERASTETTENTEDIVVNATVLESDDGGEDDAVAAVVESTLPMKAMSKTLPEKVESSSGGTATTSGKQHRRQSIQGIKPVRLPPMSSPGLKIPPGHFREVADSTTGLATPAAIFDQAMSLAGYTTESRSKRPHRGSSVKRVVDDMFDPNVKFSLHFPRLVPDELVRPQNGETDGDNSKLVERLLKGFRPSRPLQASALHQNGTKNDGFDEKSSSSTCVNGSNRRHKRKLPGFMDMAPLPLTIRYPNEYMQKRMEYIYKVNAREKAIVEYQEEELRLDREKERKELSGVVVPEGFAKPSTIIPPIPDPPTPPRLHEIDEFDPDAYEDHHPLYLPKTRQLSTVSHLDRDCFHIIDGRYFGLVSNFIADPNFVGPNAPGLGGLSLSGGTGLATANSGGGGSTGGALLSAPSQSGASILANAGSHKSMDGKGKQKESDKGKLKMKAKKSKTGRKTDSKSNDATSVKANGSKVAKQAAISAGNAPKKKNTNGPVATATSSDLRKIMEEGSAEEVEKMRHCIVRAAVYASRCGKHTRNFRAPDGKVYPDISKSFASHAGLKPCERCKNNKQGAYHCRLRRKHKELDYDGSDSPGKLAPLFKVPMEDLVIRIIKKTASRGSIATTSPPPIVASSNEKAIVASTSEGGPELGDASVTAQVEAPQIVPASGLGSKKATEDASTMQSVSSRASTSGAQGDAGAPATTESQEKYTSISTPESEQQATASEIPDFGMTSETLQEMNEKATLLRNSGTREGDL